MKPTSMVYIVLAFGLIVSFVAPHLIMMGSTKTENYQTTKQNGLAMTNKNVVNTEEIAKDAEVDLAVAMPEIEKVKEETKEVAKSEKKTEDLEPVVAQPIVFDNLTMEQLVNKLNRTLKSNLSGTGSSFAKYAIEYGIDPYLAVAITLHETGCNWKCSTQVSKCNNVGGMKSGGASKCSGTSYAAFASLDEGIKAFMFNLKTNYYDKGLNTPELMNKKYAASSAWSGKINNYINKIKNN